MRSKNVFRRSAVMAAFACACATALPAWSQDAAPAQGAPGAAPQAAAVPADPLTAADKQAIASYNLNDDVFKRLIAATKEARAQGIRPQQAPDAGQVHNLDQLADRAVSSDPRIAPLIKKYGFTPRDFLLANLALMNASMVVQSKSNPDLAKYIDQSNVNQNNVAFFEKHQSELAALQASSPANAGSAAGQ